MIELQKISEQFTYIEDGDFNIIVDIRYASAANFTGRVVDGYQCAKKNRAYMTKSTAEALINAQYDLLELGYRIVIYDSYRPIISVRDFAKWARSDDDMNIKEYFYPNENKIDLFKRGYIANYSGHSRGSTVDLSIVSIESSLINEYIRPRKLEDMNLRRFKDDDDKKQKLKYKLNNNENLNQNFFVLDDNSVQMGTHFDFLDSYSCIYAMQNIDNTAHQNRMILRKAMLSNGFFPYEYEWWHFTKGDETFPKIYFDIGFDDFERLGVSKYKVIVT